MAKVNKLNIGEIKSIISKEYTQKKIIVNANGKDYEVLVDEKFRPSKISKLIIEGIVAQKDLPDVNSVKTNYYIFLMIKYFMDIGIDTNDLTEQLKLLENMVDVGLFEQLANVFTDEDFKILSEYTQKFTDKIKEMGEQNKSQEEIEEEIENEINE